MDERDVAILDLIRLGLAGDTPSIQRYARTILRRPGPEVGAPDEFRRKLSKLLSAPSPARSALRSAAPIHGTIVERELSRREEVSRADAPIVSPACRISIERLIRERRERQRLADAGLEPTRSVLFVGPPGVGKTMAARYIAATLELPLVTLDLVSVMSSLLGKSGQNIREALDGARSTECVFLLDEVDAVAKRRDDATDVGELKRIVNLLLLELDEWPATSLLIAATNHPELLDRALWRRFDVVIEFGLPDATARGHILDELAKRCRVPLETAHRELLVEATEGTSGSELARMVRSAARESLLSDSAPGARNPLLVDAIAALARRAKEDTSSRALYCRLAHELLGMSHRQIGEALNVSHVTVGNLLRAQSGRKGRGASIREEG